MFDRNMANRIWCQYFGIGIVDPPDDFRESNPPSNPELLEFLAKEFRRSKYSLRHLTRIILTSETFARQGSLQNEDVVNQSTIHGTPFFADCRIRRMSAEALIDSISSVTDIPSNYPLANSGNAGNCCASLTISCIWPSGRVKRKVWMNSSDSRFRFFLRPI